MLEPQPEEPLPEEPQQEDMEPQPEENQQLQHLIIDELDIYFLTLLKDNYAYESSEIVPIYNYVFQPKKPMTTKSFVYLKIVKNNFKRFQKRNAEGKRKVYSIKI